MDEAGSENGENEAGNKFEEDAVQPQVEGEGELAVEPPVVDDQPVLGVAQPRLAAHPQAWAQGEEDHVGDCQEERNHWKGVIMNWLIFELIKQIGGAITIGLSNPIDFYKVPATFASSAWSKHLHSK